MDRFATDSKDSILNKLLVPQISHGGVHHNHSTGTRPSKSHSLYNVKDFLPTEESSNPTSLGKRTQTEPYLEDNSKIFSLRTVTDNSEDTFTKSRIEKNNQKDEEIKKKDKKI